MTKKTLETLYSQALADNELLTAEINAVLKIKNDLYQDFTKQVLERDNLINGLRNTILELSGRLEDCETLKAYLENQLKIHLVAKDEKINELYGEIRKLNEGDPKVNELHEWQLAQKDKEIESLEARIEEYTNIHKVNAYGLCALKEQGFQNDQNSGW